MKSPNHKNIRKTKKAFSMMEILMAITIFSMITGGILYVSLDTAQRDSNITAKTEAVHYAQNGLEAVRNIRDNNYLALVNGDKGLAYSESGWSFITAPENIDDYFQRTITIEDVYRNSSGEIDEQNGTILDPDTKKISSLVEWTEKGLYPQSITFNTYLTNWRGYEIFHTTCADFENGTFDTTVTQEQPSPPENNCAIELETIEEQSSFYTSTNLGRHANDVIVDGNYAYVAMDDTTKGFSIINIVDKNNPFEVSSLDINGKGRYLTKNGNYVFIGVQDKNPGMAIINVQSPISPVLITTLNPGEIGNQPAIINTTLFNGINKNKGFAGYDITDINNPTSYFTQFPALNDSVKVIQIKGNYAYLGLGDDNSGFAILDISNPANPQVLATLDVGEEVNALAISGPIVFAGTEDSNNSLKVIDISDPANPTIEATLNVSGEIEDIVISGNYLYAALDNNSAGMATVNISNPYNPVFAYTIDINGKGTGIDKMENYIFITTDTLNKGMQIIETNQTATETFGTYISPAIDTESETTSYNFIEWDHQEVPGGALKFQIRTSASPEGLETATWAGPDGSELTQYETSRTSITLHQSSSGTRYIQYKAEFESNGASTPVLESVKINYLP